MCFLIGFKGPGSPWEVLGDAWGIPRGQLGDFRGVLEAPRGKAEDQMGFCDLGFGLWASVIC